jgi:hypothetical protein
VKKPISQSVERNRLGQCDAAFAEILSAVRMKSEVTPLHAVHERPVVNFVIRLE